MYNARLFDRCRNHSRTQLIGTVILNRNSAPCSSITWQCGQISGMWSRLYHAKNKSLARESFYLRKRLIEIYVSETQKAQTMRCTAIESIISHLKSNYRLARNLLKGAIDDHINFLMVAGYFSCFSNGEKHPVSQPTNQNFNHWILLLPITRNFKFILLKIMMRYFFTGETNQND